MILNEILGLTCSLENMELSNFLGKRDLRTEQKEYNEDLFKELLHISHSLGRKRKNYTIVTIKNDYMNSNRLLPEEVTYFTQKIINNKTKKEVLLSELSSGFVYKVAKFKRFINRFKTAPKNIIDNISQTYISHSSIHGFGLFANKNINADEKIGRIDGQLIDRKYIHHFRKSNKIYGYNEWTAISEDKLLARPFRTKYGYINHSRLPNIKLDGFNIITIREIQKDEEIFIDYRQEHLGKNYIGTKGTYLWILFI